LIAGAQPDRAGLNFSVDDELLNHVVGQISRQC